MKINSEIDLRELEIKRQGTYGLRVMTWNGDDLEGDIVVDMKCFKKKLRELEWQNKNK